jgi:hypothetical protein
MDNQHKTHDEQMRELNRLRRQNSELKKPVRSLSEAAKKSHDGHPFRLKWSLYTTYIEQIRSEPDPISLH